jgi:cytidylate kinase
MVIAIDGPAASGKGTVAKLLAQRLNVLCLDTGAIYRGITVFFLSQFAHGSLPFDNIVFEKRLKDADIKIKCGKDKETIVFLNGTDITKKIRTGIVSDAVPVVSLNKFVQDRVRQIQHAAAKNNDLVAEGRETTSVAFPNADYKFYLDADIEERAKRRMTEWIQNGENVTFEETLERTKQRDLLDMTREFSPLIKTPDAAIMDTTGRDPNEVVDEMVKIMLK